MPTQPNEADRQRQEINMFAAMAMSGSGSGDDDDFTNKDSLRVASVGSNKLQDSPGGLLAGNTGQQKQQYGSMEMFAAAANAEIGSPSISGTFARRVVPTSQNVEAEKSNLDSALAALTKEDPTQPPVVHTPLTMPLLELNGTNDENSIVREDNPMFMEEVIMSRPLFFGALLPDRVVSEARRMVRQAAKEIGPDEHGNPPRLSQMPPGVRNLVGAIRTYGYGIDVLDETTGTATAAATTSTAPTATNGNINADKPSWKGSPYVSTFQPVWGDAIRADRVKERRKRRRPVAVTRASTAPARLAGNSLVEDIAPSTQAGQPSGDNAEASSFKKANDMFLMHLRGDEDANHPGGSVHSMESSASPNKESKEEASDNSSIEEVAKVLTEQEMFSQWARGSDTFRDSLRDSGEGVFTSSTFQKIASLRPADSDDDSVIDDELKKQVGMNDHLSKAVASLSGAGDGQPPADITAEESKLLLAQASHDASKGRPLTNFELTSGCVPMFGVDDPSLPVEGDLGIHETKEEQQRSYEQKRSQEIIEKFVAPNVFGPVACPNPAVDQDDFHSWNSRAAPSIRFSNHGGPIDQNVKPESKRHAHHPSSSDSTNGVSYGGRSGAGSTPSKLGSNSQKDVISAKKKQLSSRSRYGWWNVAEEKKECDTNISEVLDEDPITGKMDPSKPPLHLPPTQHSASTLHVVSPLKPSPEKLREDNLPLSCLHAASSITQSLPYLSDRPPSHRFLQIDTQAVGFPPIGGELEPLFCSLAIYNVETVSGSSKEKSMAPVPDLLRCGRVTEALNFDVVSDQEIEKRCSGALWPYASTSIEDDRLRGTRCGVFPLPSNLNVANLYAILVVKKVLSEDCELDPYLKVGKCAAETAELRLSAEKSSKRRGNFLMPFAFGVTPLLQVFGTDDPVTPSSRAVQIPLFRFTPGLGERQIIDHIMVMLYPRADHRSNRIGGAAAVTNEGKAMLVMRNFGYLGLHGVVDKKSSLARDRLVDFTGELQLRRRREDDPKSETQTRTVNSASGDCAMALPDWHSGFVAEPAARGGRNLVGKSSSPIDPATNSSLYAQELAPLPLQLTPSTRPTAPASLPRGRLHTDDIEPYFHTTFCNELLCNPRLLHNCPRGDIVVRVGLRELEWKQDFNAYFAHLPRCGPSVHNPRRGPFLVQNAFTSCSPRGVDPHFIDEFKVKLPLDLKPETTDESRRIYALFFSVFDVKVTSKSKWQNRAKKLFGNAPVEPSPSSGDSDDLDATGKSRIEGIACGFLPLTSRGCLLDNGIHDVRVIYKAKSPTPEMCEKGLLDATSLILVERSDTGDRDLLPGSSVDNREDSCADETTVSNDSASEKSGSVGKSKPGHDLISLSVRIVAHSSVHTQNETLSEFLRQEPDFPRRSNLPNAAFISKLQMGRNFLVNNADINMARKRQLYEERMLESAVDITKPNLCSLPRTSLHLWRVMPILWRTMICGNGEPDLVWANPAAPIPLRVHSFATILHLLGAASMYMSKQGVTQIDGTSKWNVVTLGRVLALGFDEFKLFGCQAKEIFDPKLWETRQDAAPTSPPTDKALPKRRRHVRQTYELFNAMQPGDDAEAMDEPSESSVVKAPAITLSEKDDVGALATLDSELKESDSSSSPTKSGAVKIDSITDFQTALRVGSSANDFDRPDSGGADAAKAMIQAFSVVGGSSRRWMTAPAPALSTIRETDDGDDLEDPNMSGSTESPQRLQVETDSLDDEIVLNAPKRIVRQMRLPKLKSATLNTSAMTAVLPVATERDPAYSSNTLPKSDDIENMATPFLDIIGESLGLGSAKDLSGENRRVGSSHHRKTQSRSSIDWTLLGDGHANIAGRKPSKAVELKDFSDDLDETMSTLQKEESTGFKLPNFVDRLTAVGKSTDRSARWFPYAYEVIIMQWAAILTEQRTSGEQSTSDSVGDPAVPSPSSPSVPVVDASLAHAASRAIGVAVASAPLLFEVIKQSLGYRIASLSAKRSKTSGEVHPPLAAFDGTLLQSMEQIVSMVADACIDSRNFDSWELRQMSIDVNDSIVRFLRDMFYFLPPSSVHRLILAYLSRFVTKDGKQWQDRDSTIGLRCSWEITKLRLNAVTALIRFPDLIRINGPQMLNWGDWSKSDPNGMRDCFFDDALDRFEQFRLPNFVGGEASHRAQVDIPAMRPHWLAEVVVDVCLLGTEHAEQYIQHRSASLLHEMFWANSQEGLLKGKSAAVASMHVTFLEKLLCHVTYLSNFAPKSQLRKDVLPCAVFVMQSTPPHLLRAVWRRLCLRLPGKGLYEKYGGVKGSVQDDAGDTQRLPRGHSEQKEMPDILELFSLLNLILRTLEYEGSEENVEADSPGDSRETVELWRREYLLAQPVGNPSDNRRKPLGRGEIPETESEEESAGYSASVSRKWQSHDGSIVVINCCHSVVMEMHSMLSATAEGRSLLNPAVRRNLSESGQDNGGETRATPNLAFKVSHPDIVVFVRAATSIYLHALALRESDIVIIRTFKVCIDIIKIFGIKTFLEAVGETLQHWMRVVSLHCGARRALVRIEATDMLELILRSTWECYGSFFRIRVPLLAVQTEVMERIVATAAARYYRDKRRSGNGVETFSNINAEASLVPLWRTLDRIQKQPASQNIAFRGALIRMADKLKKLYRAYVAARVLSFIQGSQGQQKSDINQARSNISDALVRAGRISVMRVINASESHSKQFLGFHGTTIDSSNRVAHYEAVEDALIDAADVFSPTELPEHRVAWLRMLADFHSLRKKYAEEATCHFHIHVTLQQAARLHGSLWSNTPFLPWTDSMADPVYIDGEGQNAIDNDSSSQFDFDESDPPVGNQMQNASSFRRIFYRVANSVGVANEEWETGVTKNLFCGITYAFEYHTVSPWISLREMEEHVVEEAEAAGDLFLSAGIIESSRFAYSLATNYYAEKFNYAKLAIAYGNLARTVVSQVPPIDVSLPQEVSAALGRFYRVWFHGGAPDELSGVEFVYRTEGAVRLDQFGQELRAVIQSIIPDRTPIHLVLDGRATERSEDGGTFAGFSRIGPAPLEPVKIKVTPLRPLFGKDTKTRGLPEWFFRYVDEAFSHQHHRSTVDVARSGIRRAASSLSTSKDGTDLPRHRKHARSNSASWFSSAGSSSTSAGPRRSNLSTVGEDRGMRFTAPGEGELAGVDKFCFVQPRDRSLANKDWWKTTSDYAEKSLKVTQLQVVQAFPACVARQAVVHRLVYFETPLEAGVDAVCQWCAVLFRTAVATVGMAVLGTNQDPGIGTDAAKVVADCIHSSHVKEIGLALLKKNSDLMEGDSSSELGHPPEYSRLAEDEVKKLQLKLSRLIVVFVELLHILIARNRDSLLDVIQERKKGDNASAGSGRGYNRATSGPVAENLDRDRRASRQQSYDFSTQSQDGRSRDVTSRLFRPPSTEIQIRHQGHHRTLTDGSRPDDRKQRHHPKAQSDDQSYHSNLSSSGVRTDSAIAVQSELQRAFISFTKMLYPRVRIVMLAETPRWLKQCTQDNYFSLGTYKQTQIPISEELCFTGAESANAAVDNVESPSGSIAGSAISRGSERYGFGQF